MTKCERASAAAQKPCALLQPLKPGRPLADGGREAPQHGRTAHSPLAPGQPERRQPRAAGAAQDQQALVSELPAPRAAPQALRRPGLQGGKRLHGSSGHAHNHPPTHTHTHRHPHHHLCSVISSHPLLFFFIGQKIRSGSLSVFSRPPEFNLTQSVPPNRK